MTTAKLSDNRMLVVYWITTAIAFTAFLIPGILNIIHSDHIMHDMEALGYPVYLPTLLGAWKISGALTIILPGFKRLKEWAYAGMTFDLTAASYSRISTGGHMPEIIIPLVICSIVMASWAFRPADRKI